MTKLRCSVVVATFNRAELLKRTLASLEQQDISPDEFEVIVVDDGSSDQTQAVLQAARPPFSLRHFRQENQGPAAARNLAITNALSNVIITVDDDVTPKSDLLRRHLELQESREHTAAMGVMVLPPDKRLSTWLEWDAVTLQKQYSAMLRGLYEPTPRQFYTANSSFKRDDALDAGLFDATFRRAEDVELAYRMRDRGVTFAFLPEAVVYHEPNRTYADWLKVPWQYGLYDVAMWQSGRHDILECLRDEYSERNRGIRYAARLLIGRKRLLNGFISGSASLAAALAGIGLRRPCRSLYSAIFNLQYWQGFCEATGDRAAFWRCVQGVQEPNKHRGGGALPEVSPPTV